MPLAIKLDRLAARILFIVIIAYGITGYGMTKGIISPSLARSLHLGWLGVIGLIVFIIHTAWAIHLSLRRKNIWNTWTKIGLAGFYIILILFFVYLQFFYSIKPKNNYNNLNLSASVATQNSTVSTPTTTPSQSNIQVFTVSTLAKYNGLSGQPAYVAIDGLVYDMSIVFRSGDHQGYSAGQDLSNAFHNQHPSNYLQRFTVVGTYK